MGGQLLYNIILSAPPYCDPGQLGDSWLKLTAALCLEFRVSLLTLLTTKIVVPLQIYYTLLRYIKQAQSEIFLCDILD